MEIEKYDEEQEIFFKQFEGLRPDLFMADLYANEDDRQKAVEELRPVKARTTIMSAIPLVCKGEKCTFANTCPLQAKNVAPVGKSCPIELSMISEMVYSMMRELNVHPDNITEVAMIKDMVDQEIQQYRASKVLAMDEFIQENVIGISDEGQPIMAKSLHLAVDFQDRILKRKHELRKQLLITREQRAKLMSDAGSNSGNMANVFKQLREVDLSREKRLREELGEAYKDEYISSHEDIIEAEIIDPS